MTQQPQRLEFGDRVRCKQTGAEGLIIDTGKTAVWIIWQGQKCSNFYAYDTFEAVPHPDTSRLDFIEKVINIDGMVKRKMGEGWALVVEHELSEPKPLLRDAIDAAMHIQAEEAV